jgi:hypothetical protein
MRFSSVPPSLACLHPRVSLEEETWPAAVGCGLLIAPSRMLTSRQLVSSWFDAEKLAFSLEARSDLGRSGRGA